jgi:hypothetical protein
MELNLRLLYDDGFMMLFGLVLSIPPMLLWLIQRQLKNNLNENKTKLILSVYFQFDYIFIFFDKGFVECGFQQIFWVVIYSLIIVIGVWIFKLPTRK